MTEMTPEADGPVPVGERDHAEAVERIRLAIKVNRRYVQGDLCDRLDAQLDSLNALPGDLEAIQERLYMELEVTNRAGARAAILHALQSAALAGARICPVTRKEHDWGGGGNVRVTCIMCGVVRTAIEKPEPAAEG